MKGVVCACVIFVTACDSTVPIDDSCAGACPQSNIKHLVVIVQENHTFDNHFGRYCTALSGSNPTCTTGPACCEAAPDGLSNLDDVANETWDPDHLSVCEAAEMNGGKMDQYASGTPCSDPRNVATSDPLLMAPYWDFAAKGALADRYFQPVIGQSSANDMFMMRAAFVFDDNTEAPQGAVGVTCTLSGNVQATYTGTTIGDLLRQAKIPWTYYAGGYAAQQAASLQGTCAPATDDCHFAFYPCTFDPSDVPVEYFATSRDNPAEMADDSKFFTDVGSGALPAVSFVRAIGWESEHPGQLTTLSKGVAYVTSVVAAVEASRYRDSTLILFTYDEGGGYFDHVAPAASPDAHPYGTRVPMVAIGKFAKTNAVSHVVMEHSSIVRFIEWNFLGGTTGQLATRDAQVSNIGSLLDPAMTGVTVPEN